MEQNEKKSDLKRLTGLWVSKDKKYMSGTDQETGIKYFIFSNNKKNKPTDPEYNLCIKPADEEQQEPSSLDDLPF